MGKEKAHSFFLLRIISLIQQKCYAAFLGNNIYCFVTCKISLKLLVKGRSVENKKHKTVGLCRKTKHNGRL